MAKIRSIYKTFTNAYKSEVSCIILDNIESLVEYVPIGMRFNNMMVQTIMTLIKENPPRGKKLLIIATTSNPEFLKDLGLRDQFTQTMTVPVVESVEALLEIVETLEPEVFSKSELETLSGELPGYFDFHVGIKKLIDICMTARQAGDSDCKISTFVKLLVRANGMKRMSDFSM